MLCVSHYYNLVCSVYGAYRILRKYLRSFIELCFSNTMLWKWNFGSCDDPDDPLMVSMRNYCNNFRDLFNDGCGLALYGPVGTGKTYAAACVANELLEKGFSVHMTDFSRVINTLWDLKEGKQKYLDRLNEYDLLIIDDLAASVTRLMPMRSS